MSVRDRYPASPCVRTVGDAARARNGEGVTGGGFSSFASSTGTAGRCRPNRRAGGQSLRDVLIRGRTISVGRAVWRALLAIRLIVPLFGLYPQDEERDVVVAYSERELVVNRSARARRTRTWRATDCVGFISPLVALPRPARGEMRSLLQVRPPARQCAACSTSPARRSWSSAVGSAGNPALSHDSARDGSHSWLRQRPGRVRAVHSGGSSRNRPCRCGLQHESHGQGGSTDQRCSGSTRQDQSGKTHCGFNDDPCALRGRDGSVSRPHVERIQRPTRRRATCDAASVQEPQRVAEERGPVHERGRSQRVRQLRGLRERHGTCIGSPVVLRGLRVPARLRRLNRSVRRIRPPRASSAPDGPLATAAPFSASWKACA